MISLEPKAKFSVAQKEDTEPESTLFESAKVVKFVGNLGNG